MCDFQTGINLCYEMRIRELDRFSEGEKFYFLKELFLKYHMSRRVSDHALKRLKAEGQMIIPLSNGIIVGKSKKSSFPVILLPCDWAAEYRKILDSQIGQAIRKHEIRSFSSSSSRPSSAKVHETGIRYFRGNGPDITACCTMGDYPAMGDSSDSRIRHTREGRHQPHRLWRHSRQRILRSPSAPCHKDPTTETALLEEELQELLTVRSFGGRTIHLWRVEQKSVKNLFSKKLLAER